MGWWPVWGFAATGLVAGFVGALVGAGGGFIAVPALVLALGLTPLAAAGCSLAMVAVGAATSLVTHGRRGRVR